MRSIKLTLPPKDINKFRRIALSTDNEVIAFLVGSTRQNKDGSIGSVRVDALVYPEQDATETCVDFDIRHLPDNFLGTIHSHPNCDSPHLSRTDVQSAARVGEVVYGVFTWAKFKNRKRRATSLDFYSGSPNIQVMYSG
jgi:proteasome lid subunit RPN8/RPN11